MITFGDFKKLDIRIGKILSAERIEGADKLLKLNIDLGQEKRQLVAGIAGFYNPEDLVNKQIPILTNLEPKSFKGIESQAMLLAADIGSRPVLLHPDKEVPPGSVLR